MGLNVLRPADSIHLLLKVFKSGAQSKKIFIAGIKNNNGYRW